MAERSAPTQQLTLAAVAAVAAAASAAGVGIVYWQMRCGGSRLSTAWPWVTSNSAGLAATFNLTQYRE